MEQRDNQGYYREILDMINASLKSGEVSDLDKFPKEDVIQAIRYNSDRIANIFNNYSNNREISDFMHKT